MLDGRNAQDAGIIGGEIARHIQLIVEARLLSIEPNAQREKAKVGGLGTVTLLRRENNPGTRNLAEPDGKPSKRQEELGIRILVVDGIPVLLQPVEGRQCLYDFDMHGSLARFLSSDLSSSSPLFPYRSRNARIMLSRIGLTMYWKNVRSLVL